MSSQLDQLKKMTKVVADTGDFVSIQQYKPVDATTNPTLVLKEVVDTIESGSLISECLAQAQKKKVCSDVVGSVCDWLIVKIGGNLLNVVPGFVSTEVDVRLSFDVESTVKKVHQLIAQYDSLKMDVERVLVKIAATWEGIKAAEILEKTGIRCNLTLVFSMTQAQACADAGVYIISPFVGRITDWYKKNHGITSFSPEEDPGVQSVVRIYNYYKKYGYETVIMGASFRNIGQIQQLSGCDCLTISPEFLQKLDNETDRLVRKLYFVEETIQAPEKISEQKFRWLINEDAMASEKLSEGIRLFSQDLIKLEHLVGSIINR